MFYKEVRERFIQTYKESGMVSYPDLSKNLALNSVLEYADYILCKLIRPFPKNEYLVNDTTLNLMVRHYF